VARLGLLPKAKLVLKSGTRLKLHTGTTEVLATIYLLEHDPMAAGDEALVQFRVPSGLVAGPGDPYIIRLPSPARTIGGGMLIEGGSRRLKRNRPGVMETVRECAAAVGDEQQFVTFSVRNASSGAISEAELSVRTKIQPGPLRKILSDLAQQDTVVELQPDLCIHRDTLADLCGRVLKCVDRVHDESPESPGMPVDDLSEAVRLDRTVCGAIVARMQAEGRLIETRGWLARPAHSAEFQGADAEHSRTIERLFRAQLYHPPGVEELREKTAADEATVKRILNALQQQQKLIRVEGGLLFHRDAIEQARDLLVEHLKREGRLESVKFKYLLDTTRKFAIPLLDHFDHLGVTRRVGNTRHLKGT
jgi:selenocysteine-specific elongation factor